MVLGSLGNLDMNILSHVLGVHGQQNKKMNVIMYEQLLIINKALGVNVTSDEVEKWKAEFEAEEEKSKKEGKKPSSNSASGVGVCPVCNGVWLLL